MQKLVGNQIGNLQFANNGQEALDLLANCPFDVVLMDIHMPVMNGIEATIEIRNSNADWSDIVIIALTADADYQQVRICRNLGMNDSVGKPVKRIDLLNAFERAQAYRHNSSPQKTKLNAA